MSKANFTQAGNKIHGSIANSGVGVFGMNVGGNFILNAGPSAGEKGEKCLSALFTTNPLDDRAAIITAKGRVVAGTCDWILRHSRFGSWRNPETRSQLLWVTGGAGMGKTMLSTFISQQLEKKHEDPESTVILYYFCNGQDNKKSHAIYVLRGLIYSLLRARPGLISVLLPEYEIQKEALFSKTSIEALWRIFETMIRDSSTGNVYCIIDGLDECDHDSLWHLLKKIKNFYLDEEEARGDTRGPPSNAPFQPQSASSNAYQPYSASSNNHPQQYSSSPFQPQSTSSPYQSQSASSPYQPQSTSSSYQQQSSSNAYQPYSASSNNYPRTGSSAYQQYTANSNAYQSQPASSSSYQTANAYQPQSASGPANLNSGPRLKMVLVSREAPKILMKELAGFPRVQLGAAAQKDSKPPTLNRKGTRRGPKIADVAAAVIRQRTLDKNTNTSNQTPESEEQAKPPNNVISALDHNIDPTNPLRQTQINSNESQPIAASQAYPVKTDLETLPTKPSAPHIGNVAAPAEASAGTHHLETPSTTPNVHPINHIDAPVISAVEGGSITSEPTEYPNKETEAIEEELEDDEDDPSDDNAQNPALRLYVEAKLEEMSAKRDYSQSQRTAIADAFQQRGDGTFLWVDLALGQLERNQSKDTETILNHLPQGLDEMYCQMLHNIPPHLAGLAAGILRWTVAAQRPLSLLELSVALNLSQYNFQDPIGLLWQGIQACGSILIVGDDEMVNIAHASVRDFLTGESPQLSSDTGLSQYRISLPDVDRDITHFCIAYLEQGCLNEGPIAYSENQAYYEKRVNKYPFLPYAAPYWPEHAREASNLFFDLSTPFFKPESAIRKNWWHTYWAAMTTKGKFLAPRNFTLVHMAAYLDLQVLVEQLMRSGALHTRLNKKDSHYKAPLDYTVEKGHVSLFLFLLQCGATQTTEGGEYDLLQTACKFGQKGIAEVLIDRGYNVNGYLKEMTPKETVKALAVYARFLPGVLNEGIDMDSDKWSLIWRDLGWQDTSLHVAALYGHAAVVEMLLERNANVQCVTTKGWTPLHAAAWTGQLECVKLLMARGADPVAQTGFGWIPLHCAASRGKTTVLQYFLDLGIQVDTLTTKQKTALHLTAYSGHANLVQLLFERGAALDAQSYKQESGLHLATRNGKPQVVELLLSLGADRTIRSTAGIPAECVVKSASTSESRECVRILETFGQPDYQPWQPKPDQTATVPNDINTSASYQTAAGQTKRTQSLSNPSYAGPASNLSSPMGASPTFQANLAFTPQQPSYQPHQSMSVPTYTQQSTQGSYFPPPAGPAYTGLPPNTTYPQVSPPAPYTSAASSPPPPYTPGLLFQGGPEKSPAAMNNLQGASNTWQQPVSPPEVQALADGPNSMRSMSISSPGSPPAPFTPQTNHQAPQQNYSTGQPTNYAAQANTHSPPPNEYNHQNASTVPPTLVSPPYPRSQTQFTPSSPVPPLSPLPYAPPPQSTASHPPLSHASYSYPSAAAGQYPPHQPQQQSPSPYQHQQPYNQLPSQQPLPSPGPQPYQQPPPQILQTFTPHAGMPSGPHLPQPPQPTAPPYQYTHSLPTVPTLNTPSNYPPPSSQTPKYEYTPPGAPQPYNSNPQPYSPNPNQQPSAFLSVSFGSQQQPQQQWGPGAGNGIYFAPPPSPGEVQKKKSWQNLGGILKQK
ncbi:MAG: hypothetical protein M1812_007453 [Candelaria pacifica]|nr:MAG: hypothetical protein M1812_007453 [Candelaria pacifica]